MTQVRKMTGAAEVKLNLTMFELVIEVIKDEKNLFSPDIYFQFLPVSIIVTRDSGAWILPSLSGYFDICQSWRRERGHGVPIYFRILQHFDIITSSFLGNSLLAKSELNSNCLHHPP